MKKGKKRILPKAALAALTAAVIVYCILLSAEKNALSAYEKGTVFVAVRNLPAGSMIEEGSEGNYFEEREMDKKLIPERAVQDIGMFPGQMLSCEIDKGTVVTQSMLENVEDIVKNMENPVVAGFKADDLYQVVSGTLRSGDRIHIYSADVENGGVYLVWENVLIIDVFDAAGTVIEAEDRATAAQRVNVLLEQSSIEQFYSELTTGSLRVVKAAG